MKHYFLTIRSYQPKNKAQELLQLFIQQFDNSLADELELMKIISRIKREIEWINQTHKRCKDITISKVQLIEVLSFSCAALDYSEICELTATEVKSYALSEDIKKSNPL